MLYRLIQKLDQSVQIESVDAHCDIPCGIYDPHQAQIGALTVIRMVDLIESMVKEHGKGDTAEFINSMARYIAVKEEHAELTKHEIRVIWGDFIKEANLEEYPQLNGLVHKIMTLGSKARQTVDRETAVALLEAVNEFAEIFWQIKGKETKRVKAPYAPAEEVVYPVL
ncbi:MAG TPA: superoxide dismutase, Ni [Anaerolineaceae bacterium]|jgi:nickel superoxide dismutase|nr:superoxide dismutase, Ni [Anaerolineaceae bacterium]